MNRIDTLMASIRKDMAGSGGTKAAEESSRIPGVDQIMRRVKDAAAAKGAVAVRPPASDIGRWQPVAPRLTVKREYVLSELLVFSDEDFVKTAYRTLLRRPPDQDSLEHHAAQLRSGGLSKVELLALLRWSPEGEARGVHVDGLLAPHLLQRLARIRVIGPLFHWCQSLLRLNKIAARQATLDAAQAGETQALGRHVSRFADYVESNLANIGARLDRSADIDSLDLVRSAASAVANDLLSVKDAQHALQLSQQKSSDTLAVELAQLKTIQQGLAGRSDEVSAQGRILADELATTRGTLANTMNELAGVKDGLTGAKDELASLQRGHAQLTSDLLLANTLVAPILEAARKVEQRAHSLDSLYADFEDKFRGSRELVRARAMQYVDFVRQSGAGSADAPIIDLGCGRGEWLELLRDNGMMAKGIDTNGVFLDACRSLGLDVIDGDAIASLHGMADGSAGAITSMHLVEHLTFEDMVALIDESLRVLRPGGALILETPNPENLMVATHWFYMDPTHRNPLPPEFLRWLVGSRGFADARVERLSVERDVNAPALMPDEVPGSASANAVIWLLGIAPDYAIVATRP
jgi:SAM-dependent methyltransferase